MTVGMMQEATTTPPQSVAPADTSPRSSAQPTSNVTPSGIGSNSSSADSNQTIPAAPQSPKLGEVQHRKKNALSRIDVDYDDSLDSRPLKEVLVEAWHGLRSTVLQTEVYLRISINDSAKRKGSFCLGFFSILLVVVLCSLLISVLAHLQVVFLRLSESENGRMDLIVSPGGQFASANSLNYSVFLSLFATGAASYHAPRIVVPSMSAFRWVPGTGCATIATNISQLWSPVNHSSASQAVQLCTYGTSECLLAHCAQAPTRASTLVFLNADREQAMGLTAGNWPYRPGPGEVGVPKSIAEDLLLSVGSQFPIFGDVSYALMQAFNLAGLADLGVSAVGTVRLPFSSNPVALFNATVGFIYDDTDEKFETSLSNMLIGNYDDALRMASDALSPLVTDTQRGAFADVSVDASASRIYINMPPSERTAVYTQRDFNDIQAGLTHFSSLIFGVLGFNQITIEKPIMDYLESVRFFSLFLGLIVSLILVALAVLSIVLIYSLLTVNIQGRTFELGIQRMIGFTKQNLTGLVFTNAMLFAIPAWGVGLAVGAVAFMLLRTALVNALGVEIPNTLTADGIGFATLAGIGIPIVAAIAPVLDVLTLSLPEALNSDRSRISAVIYHISGRKTGYVSLTMLLLGVAFTVYGFLIYYLFPLAIIDFNISLLFYIFFGILIAMLAGLVLLAVNFERVVETAVCHILLFWEQASVFHLIDKNLTAHRPRNRKTTLMYALALGFIIFITVAFNIQLLSIEYGDLMSLGGDARYRGSLQWEEFLVFEEQLQRGDLAPYVSHVTYSCDSVKDILSITNISLTSIGRYRTNAASLIAIPPNFYDVVDNDFLIVGDALPSPYSLSESLYTRSGSGRVIISTSDKNSLNVNGFQDPFIVSVATVDPFTGNNWTEHRNVVAASAWLDASPVIRFSSLPNANSLNVLMSISSSVAKSGGAFRSIRDNRIDSLLMRVSEANLGTVDSGLSATRLRFDSDVSLSDIYSTKSTLSTARTIVNLFFIFTQIMAMVICFFALLSSMSTNVLEQSKEIGILLSIGIKKFPLYRLYTWEAFVLVTAASLMGLVVGVVVAYSMMLQNSLFTQIPMKFEFPVYQLVVVLGTSLICSIIASYIPMAYLLNLPSITHILRRVL